MTEYDSKRAAELERLKAAQAELEVFSDEQIDSMIEKPQAVADRLQGRRTATGARLVKALGTHLKRNKGRAAWTYRGPSTWPPRGKAKEPKT